MMQEVNATTIDPRTALGHVQLVVADLAGEVAFYTDVLGFRLHRREAGSALLGAGADDLLRLEERKGATRATGTTGLYHFAVLVSRRVDLAQLLRRIAESRTPVQGMVDHHTHEAVYLADPEGNGIELAWDYPRDKWPSWQDLYRLGNARLDVERLFAELPDDDEPWGGLPVDTRIGHVHLHVADLAAADTFYHRVLGFDVKAKLGGAAEFVSAGGYHHHIAFNLWAGAGIPPRPDGSRGLEHFTVLLPDEVELTRVVDRVRAAGLPFEVTNHGTLVRDPSRNGVLLTAQATE
jgi:catechol 2,3-dioxygenase